MHDGDVDDVYDVIVYAVLCLICAIPLLTDLNYPVDK